MWSGCCHFKKVNEALTLPSAIVAYAPVLAAQLASGDDNLVAETVIDLMHAIWGQADPPPEWWRTPLGRLVAGSIGRDDAEAVTPSVAAAMLGVSRGRVYQLIEAGEARPSSRRWRGPQRHPAAARGQAAVVFLGGGR